MLPAGLSMLSSVNLAKRRQLRSHQSISNSAKSEFKVKTWFICNLFMTIYKNCWSTGTGLTLDNGHVPAILEHYKHYGYCPRARTGDYLQAQILTESHNSETAALLQIVG